MAPTLEVLAERIGRIELANTSAAIEIARRLEGLNHAAQNLSDARAIDRATYMTLAVFDQFQDAYDKFVSEYRLEHQRLVLQIPPLLSREEYEKRHKDIVDKINEAMPRVMFEQSQKDLALWRENVSGILAEARGRATMLATIISIGASLVVGLTLKFWK
jgi:hypothetical protein